MCVMLTCRVPLTPYLLRVTSDGATDNQLKVVVPGIIGVVGVGSGFVSDDSFSILEIHRVGLVIRISNPVIFSLQNNCAVLVVKF